MILLGYHYSPKTPIPPVWWTLLEEAFHIKAVCIGDLNGEYPVVQSLQAAFPTHQTISLVAPRYHYLEHKKLILLPDFVHPRHHCIYIFGPDDRNWLPLESRVVIPTPGHSEFHAYTVATILLWDRYLKLGGDLGGPDLKSSN